MPNIYFNMGLILVQHSGNGKISAMYFKIMFVTIGFTITSKAKIHIFEVTPVEKNQTTLILPFEANSKTSLDCTFFEF